MIKTILFDTDGVLVRGGRFSDHYAEKYGVSTDITGRFFVTEFKNCLIGKADLKEKLLPFLGEWQWRGTVDELLEYWFQSENVIDTNLVSQIHFLKNSGIRCYLTTNQEKYRTEFLKNQMGLGSLFDEIFSSAYIGFCKPQKEFFLYVINTVKIKSEETLYFDDDEKNIESAQNMGIHSYLYKDFSDFEKALKQHNISLS